MLNETFSVIFNHRDHQKCFRNLNAWYVDQEQMEEVFDVAEYKTEVELESVSVRILKMFHRSTSVTTLTQTLQVQIIAEYQVLIQMITSTTDLESVTFLDVSRILSPIMPEMILVELSMDY